MPSIYTPDATNTAQPADTDYAYLQAAELRTLKAYIAAQIAALGGPVNASVFKNRNHIINGNFDLWQRATSQTISGYGSADRWRYDITGSTQAVSQQAFTLGQTSVPYEPTYHSRAVITSVAGASNFARMSQRLESVRKFVGQTITLSFYAKADVAKNIAAEFVQSFGTGGSPSADVTAISPTTYALTTSWQKFQTTVAIPSITGKTLGSAGDDYLALNFWLDAGSSFNARTNSLGQQSGTFDIAQVQLELGGYATPFEQLLKSDILAQCQRYYQTLTQSFYINVPAAGNYYGPVSWTPMRANPVAAVTAANLVGTGSGVLVTPQCPQGGYINIAISGAGFGGAQPVYTLSSEL